MAVSAEHRHNGPRNPCVSLPSTPIYTPPGLHKCPYLKEALVNICTLLHIPSVNPQRGGGRVHTSQLRLSKKQEKCNILQESCGNSQVVTFLATPPSQCQPGFRRCSLLQSSLESAHSDRRAARKQMQTGGNGAGRPTTICGT
eukprot:scaffold49030_cov15-Tisochrysis_lutea.AAC.4